MKKTLTLVLSCILIHGFFTVFLPVGMCEVSGNTLYVGGSGEGNYTKIQDAIDTARNGDTVFVYNGTYYEHIIINKSITLIGESRDNTIIDGNQLSVDVVFVTADFVNISRFTIKEAGISITVSSATGVRIQSNLVSLINNKITKNRFGVKITGSSNSVLGNEITHNLIHCVEITGSFNTISLNTIQNNSCWGLIMDGSNNNIANNTISDNIDAGIWLKGMSNNNIIFGNMIANNYYGISSTGSFNTIFENILTKNRETGIELTGASNNIYDNEIVDNNISGISLLHSSENTIQRNTIANNSENGIKLYDSSENTIIENTIANSDYGIYLGYSPNNVISDNIFSGNTEDIEELKSDTPGFELLVTICCIVLIFLWKRKRKIG